MSKRPNKTSIVPPINPDFV